MKNILFLMLLPLLSFGQIDSIKVSVNCDDNLHYYNDKFEPKFSLYSTPILLELSFKKYKDGTYFISLITKSSSISYNCKGVIILLKDGTRINRPNLNLDVSVNNDGDYEYKAFFKLTELEVSRIIKNPITDYKLYVYQKTIDSPDFYSKLLECLKNKKF